MSLHDPRIVNGRAQENDCAARIENPSGHVDSLLGEGIDVHNSSSPFLESVDDLSSTLTFRGENG